MLKRRRWSVVTTVAAVLIVLYFSSTRLTQHLRVKESDATGKATPVFKDPDRELSVAPPSSNVEFERKDDTQTNNDSDKNAVDIAEEVDDEDEVEEEREAGEVLAEAKTSRTDRMCFVYDRPPRTGSTTISGALRQCLRSRYSEPTSGPRSARAYHISNMMKSSKQNVGVLGRHLYMNLSDVESMRAGCEKLMYVTSTKSMRDRLWSYSKAKLMRIDPVMTDEKMQKAIAFLSADGARRAEDYLEAYPYLTPDEKILNVPEVDRLEPDYIIRSEQMAEDLGKLLKAVGCESGFESRNNHKASTSTEFLKDVPLKYGDRTYVRLMRLAKLNNAKGLEKAKTFQDPHQDTATF